MNAPRLGEKLGVSVSTTNLARAGVLAVFAGLGCSAHADASFEQGDAMVNDSAADVRDNSAEERRFCNYVVENITNNRPGNLRTDIVGRGNETRFYLLPTSSSCNSVLTRNIEPEDNHGRPAYRWGARVCLNYQDTELCRETDFLLTAGDGYKWTYVVGPVRFDTFPGLPTDFSAQNYEITLWVPPERYLRTHVDFDWSTPTVNLNSVTDTGANQLNVTFSSSEGGHWSLNVVDQFGNNTARVIGGCNLFPSTAARCASGGACTYTGSLGVCLAEERGGAIFTGGTHTATIPFTAERGNYRARLQFVDLNGNPAADSADWTPIVH